MCDLEGRRNSDGTGLELEGQERPDPARAPGHTLLIAFPKSSEWSLTVMMGLATLICLLKRSLWPYPCPPP